MDTTTRIEEMQPKEDLSVIADGRRVVLKWRGQSRTDFQVHLIGPRGKLVEAYSWETTDLLRLDVDSQARGIYFLKVFGERGVIGTRKVLLPE
jgi:hypothetical protein